MKKVLIIIALLASAVGGYAQDKDTFHSSQARSLEPTQEVFIRPKIARLEVLNGENRIKTDPIPFEGDQYDFHVLTVERLQNIKATALYMAADFYDADVILGATFDVRSLKKGKGVEIVVKGYPAKYVDWEDAKDEDYIWINNIYGVKNSFEKERENTKAVNKVK